MILIQTYRHIQSFTKLLLLLLVLSLGACSADVDDVVSNEKSMLPISFSLPVRSSSSSEGAVSEVRLLAFDKSGKCIKNTLLEFATTNRTSNPILMPPGTFEFLFVANETSTLLDANFSAALNGVNKVVDLKAAVFTDVIFSSYTGITEETKMPMSAYYSEIYLPNYNYTYDQPFNFPYKIELVRALAKIEINLNNKVPDEPSVKRVTKLTVSNVPNRFSLPALSGFYSNLYGTSAVQDLVINNLFAGADYTKAEIGQLVLYVPEFLKDKRDANPPKTILRFEGTGFIPYEFELIEDVSFVDYKQPRPLSFSTLSNYSIVRNTHYKLDIYLSINRVLEGVLEVNPWEKIDSEINFSPPEFDLANFSIKVRSKNGLLGEEKKSQQEISLKTGEEAVITFLLDNPTGGIWRASVTNGLNFDFVDPALARGLAGDVGTFEVKATKAWSGTPTYTEFYIAVAGAELPLWNNTTGLNQRYIFKQIE